MKSVELLKQTVFRRFFTGQFVSLLGDQASVLAIPLTAVLVLDAGPGQLGLLTAVSLLPNLLFSLPAGAWVDGRGQRRQAMLAADVIRCVAVLSLPVAYALGHLTLVHLYVVAFVAGTLDVVFFVAYQALLVAVVKPEEYIAASSLLNGSRALTQVAGLSAGGALIGLVTAPVALVIDAVSFAFSGLQLARIHPKEPGPAPVQDRGISEGLRWILRTASVRIMLVSAAATNLFAFIGNAILVLYASKVLGLSPSLIGIVFGVGAAGGVIGAATFSKLERRLKLGPAILFASFAFPVTMVLYPLAAGTSVSVAALLMGAGEFLAAVAVLWLDISIGTVLAQEVPDRLRSRVSGAYRMINYGVRPVGALLGGLLGSGLGLRNALWISAIGAICAAFLRISPHVLKLRSYAAAGEVGS